MEKYIKNEAPVGDYWDSWLRIRCSSPECQALNWVDLGNMEDLSARDRHACDCWKCSERFWLDWRTKHYASDHFDFNLMDEDKDVINQDEVYVVKGVEKP